MTRKLGTVTDFHARRVRFIARVEKSVTVPGFLLLAAWCAVASGSPPAASGLALRFGIHPTLSDLLQPGDRAIAGRLFTHPIGPLTGGDGVNVAAADWDGDGDVDLFTGSRYGDLLYFENVGQGAQPLYAPARVMNAAGESTATTPAGELAPAVADLDGDRLPDLLVTIGREAYVYRGSAPSVTSGTAVQLGDGAPLLTEDGAVAVADVNGDELLDLLVGTERGRVLLSLNVGTPSAPKFASPSPMRQGGLPLTVGRRARIAAWKDDAGTHLAVGGADGELLLLDTVVSQPPGEVASSALSVQPEALAAFKGESLSPAAADLNGDGRTDILLGTETGFVLTLIHDTPGVLRAGEPLQQRDAPIDVGSFSAPALADWDGDGLADLIVGDDAGTIRVFPRLAPTVAAERSQARFGPGRLLESDEGPIRLEVKPTGHPYEYAQPLVVDWDGDGDNDLLASGTDGTILVFTNVARTAAEWPKLTIPSRLVSGRELIQQAGPLSMCTFDWNGDDDPDLFVGSGAHVHLSGGLVPSVRNGGIVYYENIAVSPRQQPRFFKGARLETRVPVTWPAAALEDLGSLDVGVFGVTDWDGDKRPEFIISGAYGTVYVCSTPSRSGQYPRLFLVADPARAPGGKILEGAYASCLADVNGDGKQDIVAGTARYGFVRWFDRHSLPTPAYREATFSTDSQCTAIDLSRPLPRGGTITSWRIALGKENARTQYRLKVFRMNGRSVELVGESQWRRVEPGWNAFSCRIPDVREGDLVGFASGPQSGLTSVIGSSRGKALCRSGEDVQRETELSAWSRIEVLLAVEATVQ